MFDDPIKVAIIYLVLKWKLNIAISVIGGTRKRKAKLGDMIKDATNNGRFLMGNAALTKLWNICPDNLVIIFLHVY